MSRLNERQIQERNISLYTWSNYLNSGVLIWTVITLYYLWRGLNYFDIALVQSFGAIATAVLEIPTGWVSDHYGHHRVLKLAAFSRFLALVILTLANNLFLMIVSEFLFALANASQSGAGSAFLFESVSFVTTEDDKSKPYALVLSRITGVQSVIRIAVRLVAPLLFDINPLIPFLISIFIYLFSCFLAAEYKNSKHVAVSCNVQPTFLIECSIKNIFRKVFINIKKFITVFKNLIKNRFFLVLCAVSSISLVMVSNYSQFVAPNLESMGFDIKFYGIVTAAVSLGELFGSRLIAFFIKRYSESHESYFSNNLCGSLSIEVRLIFTIALFMAILLLFYGNFPSIVLCIFVYIAINLLSTMLSILLSKQMNQVANSTNRATLLSVSNQIDEITSVVFDPIIGFGLDAAGFGAVYICLGCLAIAILSLILAYCVLQANSKKSFS